MLRVPEHPETEAGGRCASMLGMPSDDQHSTDRVFVVAMLTATGTRSTFIPPLPP